MASRSATVVALVVSAVAGAILFAPAPADGATPPTTTTQKEATIMRVGNWPDPHQR